MQSVYLDSWLGNPLHCPFCGTYVEPEMSGIIPNCEHLWAVFAFGELFEVSPSFVRLVKQFYKIEGLDDSGLELLNQTRIKTSEGTVSAEVIYDAVTAKIDELGLRAIEFQLDGGSDVGSRLYVFDRL